ncbi:MAG: F0F1 ATP synthase subunit B' [Rhodobacteraceae bacterium]|nr:F0F1 ATP synthase subunit B' [Paracoccaceae bacterium]
MAVEDTAAQQPGIPQLDFSTFPNQIFWLVIFLVAIYLIVGRVAIPRIDGIVTQRDRRIRNDLNDARNMNRSADRIQSEIETILDDARREASETLAVARAEIQEEQQQTLDAVNARIKADTAAATERIEEYRAQSRDVIEEVAAGAALEIAESFLPGRATREMVNSETKVRLEELES